MPTKTRLIVGSLALAAILSATSAFANPVKFSYSQAELSSTLGAQDTLERAKTLADDICNQEFSRFTPRYKMKLKRCAHEVTQEIVDKISHDNLDAALAQDSKLDRNRQRPSNLIRVTG